MLSRDRETKYVVFCGRAGADGRPVPAVRPVDQCGRFSAGAGSCTVRAMRPGSSEAKPAESSPVGSKPAESKPAESRVADLVAALDANPGDEALRQRAATALAEADRWPEAAKVLDALRNLTAHDPSSLPCLCRRCLPREGAGAGRRPEADLDGMRFRVEFAVAAGRVLYFWMPDELLAQRRQILRSVEADLAQRLGGA